MYLKVRTLEYYIGLSLCKQRINCLLAPNMQLFSMNDLRNYVNLTPVTSICGSLYALVSDLCLDCQTPVIGKQVVWNIMVWNWYELGPLKVNG